MNTNHEHIDPKDDATVPGYIDTTDVGVEMYLLIKDADTNETLVNQRG